MLRGRYDVRAGFLTLSMAMRLVGLAIGASHGVTWAIAAVVIAQACSTAIAGTAGLAALRRFPAAPREPLADDRRAIVSFAVQSSIATGVISFRPTIGPLLLGIVSQTTQPIDKVREMVAAIRQRLPAAEVRFIDTVCQPTKDRQEALRTLARETDVVIVVGGPDSNNSRKLTELARSLGRSAYQVSGASELRREWFAAAEVVGLTAGTSTPEHVIEEVRGWLDCAATDHGASCAGGHGFAALARARRRRA